MEKLLILSMTQILRFEGETNVDSNEFEKIQYYFHVYIL